MIFETTLKDRQRWQRRAVMVLGELLQRAWDEDLPVIAWTVGYAGAQLTGHVYTTTDAPGREDQRRAWERWTATVGATPWKEHTSGDRTHLHAVVKDYDGLVDIAIVADVLDEELPEDPYDALTVTKAVAERQDGLDRAARLEFALAADEEKRPEPEEPRPVTDPEDGRLIYPVNALEDWPDDGEEEDA